MMMLIAPYSLASQKEGVQGKGKGMKGRPNRNFDARCGRSHRSLSVRSVGYEEYGFHGGMGFYSTGRVQGARD